MCDPTLSLCMPKQSKIQKIQMAKKTKYREKIRKINIIGLSLVLIKNCILKIRSVFYCIFSNTTGKYLYWHAQVLVQQCSGLAIYCHTAY
jgi:hypothetical protein